MTSFVYNSLEEVTFVTEPEGGLGLVKAATSQFHLFPVNESEPKGRCFKLHFLFSQQLHSHLRSDAGKDR